MGVTQSTRNCPQCGAAIYAKDPRTKFCSIKCSRNFRGAKQREESGRPAPGTKRECEWCGTAFTIKKHPNRFCSPKCGAKGNGAMRKRPRKPKRTKPCKWCGEIYEYEFRSNRASNFCSLVCSGQWKKANVPTFGFPGGEEHYNWRGGISEAKRGPNWPWVRKQVLKRDCNTCQDCGRKQSELDHPLEVHHIIPYGFFGLGRYEEANELTNLVALCNPCHDDRDKHKDRLFR